MQKERRSKRTLSSSPMLQRRRNKKEYLNFYRQKFEAKDIKNRKFRKTQ